MILENATQRIRTLSDLVDLNSGGTICAERTALVKAVVCLTVTRMHENSNQYYTQEQRD